MATVINPRSADNLRKGGNPGKRPPEPLRDDEVSALIGAAAYRVRPKALGPRNQALIVVWWRSGLRLSESLALRPTDVNLREGTIRVRNGKGEVARTVGIDATAKLVLARWMDVRERDLGLPHNRGPLFCKEDGKPLTRGAAQNMLKRTAKRAGLGDRRVHPHGLRHTHAVELVRENVNVALIQRQLGHSRLDTTAGYLVGLQPQEVIDRIGSRRWTPAALVNLDVDYVPVRDAQQVSSG